MVGTVRSADRIAEAEGLGFDRVVVSEDLLGVDSHERFDIIVDPVGGVQRPELLELLAQMGRLIAVGSADSRSGKAVDTNDLWFNNTGIVGFSVGNFLAENPAAAAVSAADALEVIAEGSINLQISTYPLEPRPTHTHAWKPERCLAVLSWTSSKGPDYSEDARRRVREASLARGGTLLILLDEPSEVTCLALLEVTVVTVGSRSFAARRAVSTGLWPRLRTYSAVVAGSECPIPAAFAATIDFFDHALPIDQSTQSRREDHRPFDAFVSVRRPGSAESLTLDVLSVSAPA